MLRPSIIFGPEDNFFNQFASMSRFLPALPLIGGGVTRFQPVFVDDVARAVQACIQQRELTRGKVFELGGPDVMTFKEVLRFILDTTQRRRALLPIPFFMASLQVCWLLCSFSLLSRCSFSFPLGSLVLGCGFFFPLSWLETRILRPPLSLS